MYCCPDPIRPPTQHWKAGSIILRAPPEGERTRPILKLMTRMQRSCKTSVALSQARATSHKKSLLSSLRALVSSRVRSWQSEPYTLIPDADINSGGGFCKLHINWHRDLVAETLLSRIFTFLVAVHQGGHPTIFSPAKCTTASHCWSWWPITTPEASYCMRMKQCCGTCCRIPVQDIFSVCI